MLSVFPLLIYLGQTVSPPFFALFVTDRSVRGAFFAGGAVSLVSLLFTAVMGVRRLRERFGRRASY